jgi:hypothetical protein
VTRSMLTGEYFTVSEAVGNAPAAQLVDRFSIDLVGITKSPRTETSAEIRGLVFDSDKKRAAGVGVSISSDGHVVGQATTNISGLFKLPVPTGLKPGDPVQVQIPFPGTLLGCSQSSCEGPVRQGTPPPSQVQDHRQQATPQTGKGNIFDNWNTEGVVNRPSQATRFTIKELYYITHIWNQIERKRLMSKKKDQPNVTNVYHIHGNNPRWNTNSTDNSLNVVITSHDQVFADLRKQIESSVPAGDEQKDVLEKLTALEQATESRSFGKRYAEFISAAANHMTLIAPFIPALAEMLQKTL